MIFNRFAGDLFTGSPAKNNIGKYGKMNVIRNFILDENGLETVEWAVMASLIALGLIGVISGLGVTVLSRFQILENATSGV